MSFIATMILILGYLIVGSIGIGLSIIIIGTAIQTMRGLKEEK